MGNKEEEARSLIEKDAKYLAAIKPDPKVPLIIESGHGIFVKDIFGNEFYDFTAGISVNNLGHSHPKILEAILEQAQKILHVYPFGTYITKPQVELAELLAKITPGRLSKTFPCNSGAEAIEGSIKLARKYTMKTELIACKRAFHGKTLGALSITAREIYRKPFEPLLPECTFIPFGDTSALEDAITEKTAAFIVEPIQAEAGIIVPPDEYLPEVQKICDEHDILLIFDCIQTGFGRTGKMFAAEHWNVAPDIMALGKALTAGACPVGAFISKPEIMDAFRWPPLSHTTTYGGHSLVCVAGKACIETLIAEKLHERAADVGSHFKKQLLELQSEFPEILKEVRGKGLLLGLVFAHTGFADSFVSLCRKQGVLVTWSINAANVVRISPPLIVAKEQVNEVVSKFVEILKQLT